jgi:hypothetical protein
MLKLLPTLEVDREDGKEMVVIPRNVNTSDDSLEAVRPTQHATTGSKTNHHTHL